MKNTKYQKNGFTVMLLSFCLLFALTCFVSCENTSVKEMEKYIHANEVERSIQTNEYKTNKFVGCRYIDSVVLITLYNLTDGPNWTNSWDLTQPIDTWYGVTLNTNGCVRNLNLWNNGLNGTLPTKIAGLSSLRTLNLSSNSLSGSISPDIRFLSNLRILKIRDNQISGNIPFELGELSNLEELFLDRNQLTGVIPWSLGNLTNLTKLKLYNNQLGGCYAPALLNLCGQLEPGYNNNASISSGNNFDEAWEKVCFHGMTNCTNLVTPGDFNNDGYANNADLLYWGLAADNTGAVRPNATSNWTLEECPAWGVEVAGVNGSHQDGDGNGVVDTMDVNVLVDNYGEKKLVLNPLSVVNTIVFEWSYSDEADGEFTRRTYTIYAKNQDGSSAIIHGAAFTIDVGLPLREVTEINLNGSSLNPTNFISVDGDNKIEVAMTRRDRVDQQCIGPIVVVTAIVATKDLTGPPDQTSVSSGYTVEANGNVQGGTGMLIPANQY